MSKIHNFIDFAWFYVAFYVILGHYTLLYMRMDIDLDIIDGIKTFQRTSIILV